VCVVQKVTVEALAGDDGDEALPAGEVDITEACEVLSGWDGVYDLDRAGPPLWREMLSQFDSGDLTKAGPLWAQPFDAKDPVGTPSGLASPPGQGPDPVLVNLARAVQILDKGGVDVDVTLGEVQVAVRDDEQVPIHGGNSVDGTTNIVSFSMSWATLDPQLTELEREPIAPGSTFAEVSGDEEETTGYRVNYGTSFLLALAFTDDGPKAKAFLTYGNTADRDDPAYLEATERFSRKEWRDVAFTSDEVEEATTSTVTVRG